jgi:hypothetical protein
MFAPRGWLSRTWKRDVYRTIKQSEFFDRNFYQSQQPHWLSRTGDPLWHFVNHGWKKGFSPGRDFDTAYYLMKNDDVRLAQLNPLYHYLKYGRSERRLALRSCSEAQHAIVPDATALRYFITPSLGENRISLLIDSSTPFAVTNTVDNMVRLVAKLANTRSSSLRVLHRPGIYPVEFFDKIISALPSNLKRTLEITGVPLTLTYSDVPFYEEEESIATSWTSAFALRFTSQHSKSFLLTQEDDNTILVKNDDINRQAALQKRTHFPETWPGALSSELGRSGPTATNGIVALVDVDRFPEAYFVLLEALSMYFLGETRGQSETTVTLVGNSGPRFTVREDVAVRLVATNGKLRNDSLGRSLILMSDKDDPLPEKMSRKGFDVLHVSSHWQQLERPLAETSPRVWRVPLSPAELSTALAGALG